MSLGEINVGELYASHARHRYQLWGANAKVKQLERDLPLQALSQGVSLSCVNSKTTTDTYSKNLGDSLDILSIMKASQAVAGEIVLDALLKKIMAIVIENAGAQRGVLFLQQGKNWQIVAETVIGQDAVTLTRPIDLESERVNQLVPRAVIEYVARTRENIVLADASNDEVFSQSLYIIMRQVKSLLCMPILHQHKINGILYLENNLTTGAFTKQRIELLTLLSSWMSISIDNAQLYQAQQSLNDNLENLVDQRTQKLSAALKDIEKQGKKLYELAMKDQLTKLYNRHYLLEIADKTIKGAERFNKPLSVIVLDIDHFKQLNDTHGHQVGDQVLASVAEFLMNAMRSSDVAARFGGEEFVLLLSHCDLTEAKAKAEDLREKIQQLQPRGLHVTASFGVSALELISGEASFNALFKLADSAVYQAKREGRNRVIVASVSEPKHSTISGAL